MGASVGTPMTREAFLAWEARQALRYEFDGVAPRAMVGGTQEHDTIKQNLAGMLHPRLRGTPCRSHGSDLKIEVAGRIRYPDAFVVCSPVTPQSTVATEPAVVFEVLSDSTSRTDRITKLREYGATPSIQRYVILEQAAIAAMVFVRKGADLVAEVLTAADTLRMPEIGIDIPMAEFYDGIEFPEEVATQNN